MDNENTKLQVAQDAGVVESDQDFYTVFNTTRLLNENAIPVPPKLGERIRMQHDATLEVYKPYHEDWRNAVKVFNEEGSVADYIKCGVAKDNYVRQNVQSLIDFTYLRNPTAEFTPLRDIEEGEPEDKFVKALSATLDVVISENNIHGIGLRKYIQRQLVTSHLTNHGIVKLDYIPKVGSLDDVRELYALAQQEIKKTDDVDKLNHLYSLLERLSEEMQNRRPMGLKLKNVSAFMFFADPQCTKDDFSDASFTFEYEYLKESYIQSEFLTYSEDDQCWYYRYDKSKIFTSGVTKSGNSTQDKAKEALVDELMPEAKEKEVEYYRKDTILCVWWYDRITKQKYLYVVGQWDTPLWVYEDELQISQFFPHFLLAFSPSIGNILRYSEASYYIPHQIRINQNAEQKEFIRRHAFSTLVYNPKNVDPKEAKKFIDTMRKDKKTGIRALPLALSNPEAKIADAFEPLIPPSAQMQQLFDDNHSVEMIQRGSRLNNAMQGGEFRTNTTNDAVEAYNMAAETKVSAITDMVEETTAKLFWAITEIIVSKFDKDYVATIIGAKKASAFNQMDILTFNSQYIMRIEAGSTEKPNSAAKKREAVQIIQMLGQFGKAAPMTIISIVSKLLRKVFSPHLVTDNELALLKQEGTAALQKGVSTPEQGQM